MIAPTCVTVDLERVSAFSRVLLWLQVWFNPLLDRVGPEESSLVFPLCIPWVPVLSHTPFCLMSDVV